MSRLKNLFLKLLPTIIFLYNGWIFYGEYELHEAAKAEVQSRREGIEGKIRLNKIKLRKINKFKANLEEWKKKITDLNDQIKVVQKQLPSDINDTEVISYIQKEAELVNIKKPELSPTKENVNGFYIGKEYLFKGVGTYLQFIIFYERLQMSERLFNVRRLVIKNDGVVQKGRFSLVQLETTLESFKYNNNYEQKSGIEDIENQYRTR